MPQLGETVTEGTITRWLKQVGDEVAEDDPLFEVSTDKVDTEVPSAHAGYLRAVLVEEGDTVPIGTPLAVLTVTADEPLDTTASEAPPRPQSEPDAPGPQRLLPRNPHVAQSAGDGARFLSPVVSRLLAEHGLQPDEVAGSGQRRPHHSQRRARSGGQPPRRGPDVDADRARSRAGAAGGRRAGRRHRRVQQGAPDDCRQHAPVTRYCSPHARRHRGRLLRSRSRSTSGPPHVSAVRGSGGDRRDQRPSRGERERRRR